MKLSSACQQDLTLCPSDAFLPRLNGDGGGGGSVGPNAICCRSYFARTLTTTKKLCSQRWWKNMLAVFLSICLTKRQRGLMRMSTFCMLELFPMNLSDLSCFGWPSWVSVGPRWYLGQHIFLKTTLKCIIVMDARKKRRGGVAPLQI